MTDGSSPSDSDVPAIDTTVPQSARIWNYWLGGKDNYPVDREVGDRFREICPGIADIARAERAFLVRAVSCLAGEMGVRQFLDIGTGMPTAGNTHEIAQAAAPECRVVYVDNDPLVLAHARALLVGTAEGATDYVHADVHDPEAVVAGAARTLDFSRPVGLTMLGVLGHVTGLETVRAIVRRLLERLPSGSHLAICDGTAVHDSSFPEATRLWNENGAIPYHLRTPEEIASLFDGLELLEPGVVSTPLWRPESTDIGAPQALDLYGGVGRKP